MPYWEVYCHSLTVFLSIINSELNGSDFTLFSVPLLYQEYGPLVGLDSHLFIYEDHSCVILLIGLLWHIVFTDPIFSFSPLAIHTRNLLVDPRCTLVVQVSYLIFSLINCIWESFVLHF